jgi:hypothetical protein
MRAVRKLEIYHAALEAPEAAPRVAALVDRRALAQRR